MSLFLCLPNVFLIFYIIETYFAIMNVFVFSLSRYMALGFYFISYSWLDSFACLLNVIVSLFW